MKRLLTSDSNGDGNEGFPHGIEIGKKYRLSIERQGSFFSVQYGFKPSNIDTTKAGILDVDSFCGEAKSYLFRKDDDTAIEFRGILMQTLSESAAQATQDHHSHIPTANNQQGENSFVLEYEDSSESFIIKPFTKTILNLRQTTTDSSAPSSSPATALSGNEILKKFMQKAKHTQQKKVRLQAKADKEVESAPLSAHVTDITQISSEYDEIDPKLS